MITDHDKISVLEKIVASPAFAHAETYKNLLCYLFDYAIKNVIPKETTIAIEFLNKTPDFNPAEDTSVRVHMFKLREKLNSYYQQEGKTDSIRLIIPKGHYEIIFVEQPVGFLPNLKSIFRKINIGRVAIAAAIIVLFGSTAYLSYQQAARNRNIIARHDPIWSSFVATKASTVIALGDHFFFREYQNDLKRWRYIRDTQINNGEDFEAYKKQLQSDNKKMDYLEVAYFSTSNVLPMPYLIHLLSQYQPAPQLYRASRINSDVLLNNNIIFIGNIVTLGYFSRLLKNSSFEIDPDHRTIKQNLDNQIKEYSVASYSALWEYHKDFALVIKAPGLNDNCVLILADFLGSGTKGAAKYLTTKTSLQELETNFKSKYQEMPQFFELLFEVECFKLESYKINLLHYAKLPTSETTEAK